MPRNPLICLLFVLACKDDMSGSTTSASQPTVATEPDLTTGADSGATLGATATGADSGVTDSGTTGVNIPGTTTGDTTTSATNPTSATSATNPTNSTDPPETAFVVPMTDEGGSDPSNPTNPSDPSGGGEYGQCGWSDQNQYYDCADAGGVPGAEDPNGQDPIACPDGLMEGAPCDEQGGPVKNVGCCAPGGTLYYCTSQGSFIVKQECGA